MTTALYETLAVSNNDLVVVLESRIRTLYDGLASGSKRSARGEAGLSVRSVQEFLESGGTPAPHKEVGAPAFLPLPSCGASNAQQTHVSSAIRFAWERKNVAAFLSSPTCLFACVSLCVLFSQSRMICI